MNERLQDPSALREDLRFGVLFIVLSNAVVFLAYVLGVYSFETLYVVAVFLNLWHALSLTLWVNGGFLNHE